MNIRTNTTGRPLIDLTGLEFWTRIDASDDIARRACSDRRFDQSTTAGGSLCHYQKGGAWYYPKAPALVVSQEVY